MQQVGGLNTQQWKEPGATTLRITTLSITTFSIATLSIMTFNITINKRGHLANDIQNNITYNMTFSITALRIMADHCHAECHLC